jgi:hypothetical protein
MAASDQFFSCPSSVSFDVQSLYGL